MKEEEKLHSLGEELHPLPLLHLSPFMQGVLPALLHALAHLASSDALLLPSHLELHGQIMQVGCRVGES